MARRTYSDYQTAVEHALGGSPATGVTTGEIVESAIARLCTLREWYWRRGGPVALNTMAPITLSGATWTEATKTITKTGAFADYTFRANDKVEITGGTDATTGLYAIAGKTDDDNITLEDSIGASADGNTDIAGTIEFPYVILPSDFGELVSAQFPDSFSRTMVPTSLSVIEAYRANPITAANFSFHYAVNAGYAKLDESPTTGLEEPRLELYPAPTTAGVGVVIVTYLRDVPRSDNANDVPPIPEWLDYPLELMCRSMAMVVEDDNPDNASEIMLQRMMPELIRRDRAYQRKRGVMVGGLYGEPSYSDQFYPDRINDPV